MKLKALVAAGAASMLAVGSLAVAAPNANAADLSFDGRLNYSINGLTFNGSATGQCGTTSTATMALDGKVVATQTQPKFNGTVKLNLATKLTTQGSVVVTMTCPDYQGVKGWTVSDKGNNPGGMWIPATFRQGQILDIKAYGFAPGEKVTFTAARAGLDIKWAITGTANDQGVVTVKSALPYVGAPDGTYTLTATGSMGHKVTATYYWGDKDAKLPSEPKQPSPDRPKMPGLPDTGN